VEVIYKEDGKLIKAEIDEAIDEAKINLKTIARIRLRKEEFRAFHKEVYNLEYAGSVTYRDVVIEIFPGEL